ncbi:MAG: MotA/TolQ/ExbB proton channel family protein [Tepidamorphaceae bacterium]
MEFSLLDPLRSLVETGGPVVGLLLAVSVVALTLIVVKIAHFWRAGVGRHRRARNALAIWESGDKSAALAHAHEGVAPVSRLLAHGMRGLRQPGGDMTLIREDVERVAIEILASLRSGLRALDAIAQVAPLLGLFGTVLGMIEAFRALQAGAPTSIPPLLPAASGSRC